MQIVSYEVMVQNYDDEFEMWVNIGYKKEKKLYKYNYSENELKRKARRKAKKYRNKLRNMGICVEKIKVIINSEITIENIG